MPPGSDPGPLVLVLPGADVAIEQRSALLPDHLISRGEVAPMTLVWVAGRRGLFVNWKDGSRRWEDFLLGELPNVLQRDWSAVLGVSMGGAGALRLAFKHPGRFRAVSAIAPAIEPCLDFRSAPTDSILSVIRPQRFSETIFGRPVDADGYWTANHPPALAQRNAGEIRAAKMAIGLFCGDDDDLASDGTLFLHRLLEREDIAHRCEMTRGGRHDEAFFARAFVDGLELVSRTLKRD
jgi:S-formylglutathione hydrolase